MRIKTSFETLDTTMTTVSSIVSDRLLTEDLKNVVIWLNEGKVYFAAYSGTTLSATDVDAEVHTDEGEHADSFIQLKAKDINDVLAAFKGLKRTRVSGVDLEIRENEAILHVFEEPLDDSLPNADSYRQESKYRITKPRVKELVKKEIESINVNVQGTQVDSAKLLLYISALLPTVAKETRESTNNVFFGEEYIYTFLQAYTALIPNKLDKVLSGFRLSNTVVTFLKNFIQNDEIFTIEKDVKGNGMIVLTLRVGRSVAVIKCADMSRAYDITNFVNLPDNGIVVDKDYLVDVLKRVSLSTDAAHVQVDMADGQGSMRIASKNMTQNIPVNFAKGEGNFSFQMKADLLSTIIFSHLQELGDNVFLYFDQGDRGNTIMGVKDNLDFWQTKLMGLTASKGDFAWS